MKELKSYISAYYTDEEDLKKGVLKMKENNLTIHDVLTPFPIHGMDKLLNIRRSYIPRVGFIGGAIGGLSGFIFQTWVLTKDYPLNIGGKPGFAIPSFIPVTFECTVLFAAFAMVFAFLFRSKLGAGAVNKIYDEKITDDRFVVVVNTEDQSDDSVGRIKKLIHETGAEIIEFKKTV